MKNQTQKNATASPKARRKSETLTLTAEAAWLLNRLLARFEADELSFYKDHAGRERARWDAHHAARMRRYKASNLLALACEAILERPGSIMFGSARWKLGEVDMSEEEFEALCALRTAHLTSLAPISDAEEEAAIRKLEAGKSTAPRKPSASEAAPAIAPCRMGCIEREGSGNPKLFSLEMLPAGWQRIQEMLAEHPEVKIVFRNERGERDPFTGWRFVTATEDAETDDES